MHSVSRHQCMIYEGAPSVHLPAIAAVAAERLKSNYRCLYLNSPTMVAGMRTYLAAGGLDVMDAVRRGALMLSSSQEHLIDGEFDIQGMVETLRAANRQALAAGYVGLWASGDMLWEFGSERNLPKLLAYELSLEGLFDEFPTLCGVCLYHRDVLPPSATQAALDTHRSIFINETLSRYNSQYSGR